MGHTSCPESGRHGCFPSNRFSMQILHTSQWKDVSLSKLKNSFFKLNDRVITSLTLFQAGGCFSKAKTIGMFFAKVKQPVCNVSFLFPIYVTSLYDILEIIQNVNCCAMQNFASLRSQQHSEQILLARQSSLSFTNRNLLRLEKF